MATREFSSDRLEAIRICHIFSDIVVVIYNLRTLHEGIYLSYFYDNKYFEIFQ